ncbi:uncharacterized protein LOC117141329 isoform X1 [Drosophila mauritiana]|uniref:Uncharacterized protein LOC117141329 isoform X1 n=1 Tax=Drosophila mauritiana TaxID=7226 RepID=A0A6P8KBR4_DROMA|nr:uncharacterized protein LOC117141329 isoform X1 [Drosophila mauritiana]
MSIWPIRTLPNSKMRSCIMELGRTNRHTDCTFIIEDDSGGNQSFPCHKLLFSCASEAFDRMLYGDYIESTSGVVRLNDVQPDVFEKFRDYVYGYESDKLQKYDFDTLIRLCEFANKYLVQSLEEDCVKDLLIRKNTFDMGELLRLFQCAHRVNRKSLINQIAWELKCTFKSTLDHSGVYEFNSEVFKHYIEVIASKISEADRFRLLEMYLKYNGIEESESVEQVASQDATGPTTATNEVENQESELPSTSCAPLETECSDKNPSVVSDLIALIDFGKLSPKEFYDGPGKSNFLRLAEKYEHMYQIAKNCVAAKDELKLKVALATGQKPQPAETRRIAHLGGSLIREDPTVTPHYLSRPSRRYRAWSAQSDV